MSFISAPMASKFNYSVYFMSVVKFYSFPFVIGMFLLRKNTGRSLEDSYIKKKKVSE
jgi:hypothetical protein